MAFDLSGYLSQFAGPGGAGGWGRGDMGGLNLNQLFGQQQGWLQGMGPDLSNMQNIMQQLQGGGFGAGMDPFIQQLQGFKPELAGDVRGTLSGIMQDPWGGTAGGTLEEMLTTGAPTDVSGIGEASAIRGNRAFEQLTGAAQERAAISGGLAGSGFQRGQQRIGGDIADMMQARMLEAGVGAQEAASGRRMGALGLNLQGQGLAAQTAQGLGGLENQLSGQQLQALLGGGGLAGQQAGLNLQGLLGAGGMAEGMAGLGLQGQIAQATGGQNFLNMLPGFAQAGAFGMGDMLTPHQLSQYIGATGSAENALLAQNPYFKLMQYLQNPTKPSSPAAPAGGGGGDGMGSRPATGIGSPHGISDIAGYGPYSFMGAYDSPATAGGGGVGSYADPSKGEFGWTAPPGQIPKGKPMATFTPPGQPMPQHPSAAQSPTGGSYQDWANYWQQYAQQFSNPGAYTASGWGA